MHRIRILARMAATLFVITTGAFAQTADVIYTNGKIYTVDDANPSAEGVAISDRKFIAVGSSADLATYKGPDTKVIDLKGAFVMPGVIDVHVHAFEDFHRDNYQFGIEDNSTVESILAAVKAYAETNPDKEWIVGGSWPPGMFKNESPRREVLDAIIPDRPIFILDQSAHSVWMNTKALELSGIMRAKDEDLPDGSVVVRDEDGKPSGTIREFAIGFARRSMPKTPDSEWLGTAKGFQAWFHAMGITGAKAAAGNRAHIAAVHKLDDIGQWKFRLHMALSYKYFDAAETLDEQLALIKEADSHKREFFDPRGFKIFLDGTPPTREGWVLKPYPGTHNHGVSYYQPEELKKLYLMATDLNRTVMAHATGDRSVQEALNAIAAARKARPGSRLRHHITHNGLIHADDLKRYVDMGLTVDLSPILGFPQSTLDGFAEAMGKQAVVDYSNPRRVLDAGAHIAAASDWSVGPIDPWKRIGFLVSRFHADVPRDTPYLPHSALTPQEAIRASTLGPAHVLNADNETGSIKVGKFADMIVLDRDITVVPPTEIKNTKVLRTIFAGEEVYRANQ